VNPTRLRLANYATFETLDLALPTGCVGIVGTNGAGKSTLLGAIEVALFGPEDRSLAPRLTAGGASTELELELTFEHDGEVYRVRRGYSGRGRGKSTLDLEQARDDGFAPLTRETQAETQAELERILRLRRETFRASAFLAQDDAAAFTAAQPRDRKQILADVLGLEQWQAAHKLVAADHRAAEQEAAELDGRMAVLEETAVIARAAREECVALVRDLDEQDATIARLELRRDELARESARLDEAAERYREACVRADTARRDLDAARVLKTEAETARDELADVMAEAASLATPAQVAEAQAAVDEHGRLVDAIARANAAYHAAAGERTAALTRREELEQAAHAAANEAATHDRAAQLIEGGAAAHCPLCGQSLEHAGQARATAVAGIRRKAAEAQARALELRAQVAAITVPDVPERIPPPAPDLLEQAVAWLERVRAEETRRVRLEERARILREKVAAGSAPGYLENLDRLAHAVVAAEQAIRQQDHEATERRADVRAQQQQHTEALADLTRERAKLAEALGRLTERRDRADRDLEALARLRHEREELGPRIRDLEELKRAFGRDGVPAWIVEHAAIPHIESEASRILAELGGPVTRVELRTESVTKAGTIVDALDIACVTDDGTRDYATFSGGERTRINLALRIALARLLARRRGADSRLLAIDEPSYLDEQGVAALVGVLRDLDDFDRIYVTSHQAGLRDAFEQTLIVTRDAGAPSAVMLA
jgi:exonuclease SbcC